MNNSHTWGSELILDSNLYRRPLLAFLELLLKTCHKLPGLFFLFFFFWVALKKQNLCSHSSASGRSKTKVSAGHTPSEAGREAPFLAPSQCVVVVSALRSPAVALDPSPSPPCLSPCLVRTPVIIALEGTLLQSGLIWANNNALTPLLNTTTIWGSRLRIWACEPFWGNRVQPVRIPRDNTRAGRPH